MGCGLSTTEQQPQQEASSRQTADSCTRQQRGRRAAQRLQGIHTVTTDEQQTASSSPLSPLRCGGGGTDSTNGATRTQEYDTGTFPSTTDGASTLHRNRTRTSTSTTHAAEVGDTPTDDYDDKVDDEVIADYHSIVAVVRMSTTAAAAALVPPPSVASPVASPSSSPVGGLTTTTSSNPSPSTTQQKRATSRNGPGTAVATPSGYAPTVARRSTSSGEFASTAASARSNTGPLRGIQGWTMMSADNHADGNRARSSVGRSSVSSSSPSTTASSHHSRGAARGGVGGGGGGGVVVVYERRDGTTLTATTAPDAEALMDFISRDLQRQQRGNSGKRE